ncbi:unnamed protein product, partial [Ectocarpus sp. 12 AP-2014]
QGPVATVTGERIDAARHAVLQHFGVSPQEWSVVFTSGATSALKMVGEQFPWRRHRRGREGSRFVHARRSHSSVLGIREYARAAGAGVDTAVGISTSGSNGDGKHAVNNGGTSGGSRDGGNDTSSDSDSVNSDAENDEGDEGVVHSLFAFPAECNATGLRADLGIAGRVKQGALST